MAYVLVLLGLVGAFVWVSPAREGVSHSLADSGKAIVSVARDAAGPLAGYGSSLLASLREKAMALIRHELHDVVDSKVQ